MKYVFQMAMEKGITRSTLAILPSIFVALQGNQTEITAGSLVKISSGNATKYSGLFNTSAFYFGAHYRWKDAAIIQIYYEFTDYMIGVSYDMNVSKFNPATKTVGGFEVSLKYVNKTKAIMRKHFK